MASGTFYPAASGDDGYDSDSSLDVATATLWLGTWEMFGTHTGDIFVRFANVTIPQGATIDSCSVKFTAKENDSGDAVKTLAYFNNVDNAVAPTSHAEFVGLAKTASVTWNSIEHFTDGTQYDTPEFKTILQTVVDRVGWSSGNAVTVMIFNNSSDTDAKRQISAYDFSSAAEKAELHVTWTSGDLSLEEGMTSSDSISDLSEVLTESLSSADDAPVGWTADAVLAESLSSADALAVLTEVTLLESLSSADDLAVGWTAYPSLAETLLSDDTLAVGWTLSASLAESLVSDDDEECTTSNVFGRHREPTNLSANRISMKFQNNTEGQAFKLVDFGALIFAHLQARDYEHAVNLRNQHIQLKIQNNTVSETLQLFDFGARIYKHEQR